MTEIQSPKQVSNPKQYDLEGRCLVYARRSRTFVARLPKTQANYEDSKQVIRSTGSVGANYIEANEALSRKDFSMRIKISRKEAKESAYWYQLLLTGDDAELEQERLALLRESQELMKIFGAILQKSERR